MALLWRGLPGDRAARIDCCSGCEAGIRPPASVWKQFAHSPCLQCFVFRPIFPLGNQHNPLPLVHYIVSRNFIEKGGFFQRTLVAAVLF